MPKRDRFITPSTVKALIDKHLAETADNTARSALLAIRQDLNSLPLTEAIITHHGHWIRYLDGEHIMPEDSPARGRSAQAVFRSWMTDERSFPMSNHKATSQHFREKCDETASVLPDYCISYIRSIRQHTAPRTQYEYVKDIRMFLQWIEKSIGHMPDLNDLAQLTRQNFEDYMEHLEYYRDEHGRVHTNGRSSLARKLSSLSRFFNYLFQNDMLPRDETRKIQAPKVPKKNIIRLEKDETADLLHAVSGNAPMTPKQADYHAKQQLRDTAIIQLMLATGIRVSECADMDLNDIDLNHHCIRIVRKGGDEATVYMSDNAQEALEAWLDHRASLPCPDTETAVFLSSRNTRMSVRAIEYMVRKYASWAVPAKHITPHKFRGTYATELYRATGDIYLVAETLGHKDITTTREHYASMTDDRKQAHRNTVDYKKEE